MPTDSKKMIANFSSIQMIAYIQLIATKKYNLKTWLSIHED